MRWTLNPVLDKEKVIVMTKANTIASDQYTQTLSSIKKPTQQEKSQIITS